MKVRAQRLTGAALLAAGLTIAGPWGEAANAQSGQRELVNQGVVGIIAGNAQGTYLDVVADLAHALNKGYDLRILPIVGEGSVRNIEDLLYLRGIDIAIVQSDVLDFYQRSGGMPGIERQISYVTKLFDEEVHLLARDDIATIDELEGRRVNFGSEGDGSFLTTGIIFKDLALGVEVSTYPQQIALEMLRAGEIDAMVAVNGKPMPLLADLAASEGLHLLDIPPGRVQGAYTPSQISAEDYPGLVAPGQSVETVAVAAVMAAYNWPADHPRGENVRRFVAALFSGDFQRLLSPPFHPKWREVDRSAAVPNWSRLAAVDAILASQ